MKRDILAQIETSDDGLLCGDDCSFRRCDWCSFSDGWMEDNRCGDRIRTRACLAAEAAAKGGK